MEILETKIDNNVLLLAFKGRLDANSSNAAQDQVLAAIDRGEIRLLADLARLEYISSAGLRIFMMAAKRLKPLGGKVVLCSLSEPIKEIFEIAGFVSLFPIHPERDEAVKSF